MRLLPSGLSVVTQGFAKASMLSSCRILSVFDTGERKLQAPVVWLPKRYVDFCFTRTAPAH